jgi:hypothetical protein
MWKEFGVRHARAVQGESLHVLVELKPFGRLPAWAAGRLEAEAHRLAAFLGGELDLRSRRPLRYRIK